VHSFTQAYFLNFVSKFESQPLPESASKWGEQELGPMQMLAYSADFTGNTVINPRGGRYGLVMSEVLLARL
jgi:hypothetical protein